MTSPSPATAGEGASVDQVVLPGDKPGRTPRPVPPARQLAGSIITILAVCLLAFAAWMAVFSRLHYDRAQHDAYANFRYELAQAIAPTGPTVPGEPGKLLPLGSPVALLTIRQLGISAVVLEGTTSGVLEDGPGHLRDTQLPGQAGESEILGRRAAYGGVFSRLASIKPGTIFTVTTGQGVSRYRVLDIRRAGDPVPAMSAGQGRLVLTTADGPPFAPTGVLRVDANLISRPFPAPQMVVRFSDLSPAERVLGIEPLALVPLIFWGQGLLLAVGAVSYLAARWGRWQAWIVAIPLVGFCGVSVADQVTRLLPNLL